MGKKIAEKKSVQDMKRERIVLISSTLFLEYSIEEIKMTDIAKECELGVATLYRYFGTKTNLVIEAGTMLWKDLEQLFHHAFYSDFYQKKKGIEQIEELLSIYMKLYHTQKEFLKFLGEFDSLMLQEKVEKEKLREYEDAMFDFYTVGYEAFKKGQRDGTIRKDIQFADVYYTFTHALLGLCQKFNRGPILLGDESIDGARELEQLIRMVIYYLLQM